MFRWLACLGRDFFKTTTEKKFNLEKIKHLQSDLMNGKQANERLSHLRKTPSIA